MSSPTHKIRIETLQTTIWRYVGDKQNWYTVKLTRGFKTDEGWRDTKNLGYDDLLTAAKLLDQTHAWIGHQLDADRNGRKAQPA